MKTQPMAESSGGHPSLTIRVLGCAGAIAKGHRTTSFLVNGTVLTEGDPDTIAHDSRVKAVYLGHGDEIAMEGAHG